MNNDVKKKEEEKQYMKDPTCPFLSHKLPPDVNEVAYVIAKVYKYGNIDDYAEKLIRDDIERRTRNSDDDDIDDSFKEYLKKILPSSSIPPPPPPPSVDENLENDDDDDV